jgi:hypothetical protein
MPYDLNAVERGYGECEVEWQGHSILLRYRADLNNRALIAMKRAVVGVEILGGGSRFPDVEAIVDELLKAILPLDHEYGPGWDLTDNGTPVPVSYDALVDLPPGLPAAMLGAIFRDVNDSGRRKPSRRTSSLEGGSLPITSPTTGTYSSAPSDTASTPTTSVTPIGSIPPPAEPSPLISNGLAVGFAGVSGTAS